MFCTNCGTKLNDVAKFCPQCGEKVVRDNSPDNAYFGISVAEVMSADVNKLKESKISDTKKYLYGVIVSLMFVFIFGMAVIRSLTPNMVKCEVTYASEPEKRGIHKLGNPNDFYWLQSVKATYKGKEWENEFWLDSEYEAYRRGDTIELCLVGGELTDYKQSSFFSFKGLVQVVFLLASIGSCVRFALQYVKKRG